jgi:hypothetical protein
MWMAFLGIISAVVQLLNKIWPSSDQKMEKDAIRERDKNDQIIDQWVDAEGEVSESDNAHRGDLHG